MTFAEPHNKNYCAVVVALKNFVDLPNCDNVKAALIFGNSVIVGKDQQPGDVGLFFPVETALSTEFLAANNLYRKPEWGNVDGDKKGFFEQHGRVKAMKFRGHKSEGFWIPLAALEYLGYAFPDPINFKEGLEFDEIDGHPICQKYVPKRNPGRAVQNRQGRKASPADRLLEGQFRFHADTEQLRRNMHALHPDTWISISDKWHGTSAIFANVLTQRELPWYERVLRALGVKVQEADYGYAWASRRVIKGVDGEEKSGTAHWYDTDIWGVVGKEVADRIPKGYTVYGEIVGYTPTGEAIQKGYHYGCEVGSHKFLVYRATVTNQEGKVLELSWLQLKEFCAKYGFEMVREIFYGTVADWVCLLNDVYFCDDNYFSDENWRDNLLQEFEKMYVADQMCPFNKNEVPAEGIVIRLEHLDCYEAYKLKSFLFLKRESDSLDKGELDMETAQDGEEVADETAV